MIDSVDYLLEVKLFILVQNINIQNNDQYTRKLKFVFAVLKQAFSEKLNIDFTLRVSKILNDDEVFYLKEISGKWKRLKLIQMNLLENASLVSMQFVLSILQNVTFQKIMQKF